MKILGSLLIALTTVTGCSKQPMNSYKSSPQPIVTTPVLAPAVTATDTITYLALGDSYTFGQGVSLSQTFPYQLASLLRLNNYIVADPMLIARTGWTTGQLSDAIAAAALKQKFTIVTLLIGVNNQYQKYDPDTYRSDFSQLVNTAILLAGGYKNRVFVVSIPDYSVTPFVASGNKDLVKQQVDVYNAVNEGESGKAGVNYLDITAISRMAANDPTMLVSDDLHPSALMYSLWVKELIKQVTPSLTAKY